MKFSIIIPNYNNIKWLDKCINSVLKQKDVDYEVILVDDGSTDKSRTRCDELGKLHPEIKAILQENQGVARARNTGLDHATGDYVFFLDSDDYLLSDQALINIQAKLEASQADVLVFDFKTVRDGDDFPKKRQALSEEKLSGEPEEALLHMIETNNFTHLVWDKVFKRSMIEDNNIRFLDVERLEDSDFLARVIKYAERYEYLDDILYAYVKHEGSLTAKKISRKMVDEYYEIFKAEVDFAKTLPEKRREAFYHYIAYPYIASLGTSALYFKKKGLKQNGLYSFNFLFDYTKEPRLKSFSAIYKIFGKKITFFILRLMAQRQGFEVE